MSICVFSVQSLGNFPQIYNKSVNSTSAAAYLKLFFEFLLSLLFLHPLVSLLSELVEVFNVIQVSAGEHRFLGVFGAVNLRPVHLSVLHRGRDFVTALLPCRLLLQSVLSHLELHRHIAVVLLRFLLAVLLQLRERELARLELDWFGRGKPSLVLLWRTLLSLLPFLYQRFEWQ